LSSSSFILFLDKKIVAICNMLSAIDPDLPRQDEAVAPNTALQ
jgi:hypothetical protein